MENKNKSLLKAINQVLNEVSTVKKEGENKHHHYNYATEEDVLKTVRPAMLKAGLMILPINQEVLEIVEKGKFTRIDIRAVYRLAHLSGEFHQFSICASGIDTMDKAFPKALSMALKYAYFQAFNLAKGDDPDHTTNTYTADSIDKNESNVIFLNVPFEEKDDVKKLGARWDKKSMKWKIYHQQKAKFDKWLPYMPSNDTKFVTWCNQFGGFEKIESFMKEKFNLEVEQLQKFRIEKFMMEVEKGELEISLKGNR
jgi:hypothetical protein